MLTCKETTQLASESLDRKLTLRERLALRLHCIMCDMCTPYSRRLKFLRRVCADADDEQLTGTTELTDVARARIRKRLRQEQ